MKLLLNSEVEIHSDHVYCRVVSIAMSVDISVECQPTLYQYIDRESVDSGRVDTWVIVGPYIGQDVRRPI